MNHKENHDDYIEPVRQWLQSIVIELNLCPFARRELVKNRVRFSVSEARDEMSLLNDLRAELDLLASDETIETTLLIHPWVLQEFGEYNDFLDLADALLTDCHYAGYYQVASFHPDYQFAETEPGDVENYTNRTPYPLLHLLDEASIERGIEAYAGSDQIPARNIALLREMGKEQLQALYQACLGKKPND